MNMTETMKRWRGRAFGAKGGALTGSTVLKRGAVALGLVLSALCVGRAMGQVIPDADLVAIPGRNYRLQRTEVTQRQWESVMGSNPSKFRGPDRPVENVSWKDCQEFIRRASEMDGRQYRLPTELEWEHACRAGSTGDLGRRANGECGPLDAMGWYEKNSGGETHPVAQKEPNAWGLYDMHGNVREWCQDLYESGCSFRVLRGGSWDCVAGLFSASFRRDFLYPDFRRDYLGFRLVAMGQVIPDADMVAIPGRNYRLQRTEVTQRQWEAVMGSNPSKFCGPDRPVENVSWKDCQEFIKRASAMDGCQYRLPTAEEWEYACRAGSTGDWGKRANGECGPLDMMGWYGSNSGGETHPVAQKEPNAWGLYDMHGNVWEWCQDESGISRRVSRGGGWLNVASYCSASIRGNNNPDYRDGYRGFRLAAPLD